MNRYRLLWILTAGGAGVALASSALVLAMRSRRRVTPALEPPYRALLV